MYVFLFSYRENSEKILQSYQRCWVYQVIVFTALCLRFWLHTTLRLLWTHVLESTHQPCVLGLNVGLFTSESHSRLPSYASWACISDSLLRSLTPNWPTSFILLFRSRRISLTQLFVWSSRQNRQRGPSRYSNAGQKMRKIRSLLWPPIHEHRESHTHTSIYIYIYTRTLMLIMVPKRH